MSTFTTPFIGELVGNNLWKVHEEFEYHIGKLPSVNVIKVPVGFKTNFASVPRIFWMLISPIDTHGKAAVVHDYLYYTQKYNRKRSDCIFKEGMEVLKVPKWKIFTMFWVVRLCGWYRWNQIKKLKRLNKI